MNGISTASLIVSLLLTWGIGLTPPLVIRYAVLKRPLKRGQAIAVAAILWFCNLVIFIALGSQSQGHFALTLVAFVSYWVLRKKLSDSEAEALRASVNEISGDGATPLIEAAMLANIKKMTSLISAGADIDLADDRSWTPLMHAASRNEIAAVELLLRYGANTSTRNKEGQTAAEVAQLASHSEVFTMISMRETMVNAEKATSSPDEQRERNEKLKMARALEMTELMMCVADGNKSRVQELAAVKASINMQDLNGATALMYAAKNGQIEIIQCLLANGADCSIKTDKGSLAIDFAKRGGHKDIARLLA